MDYLLPLIGRKRPDDDRLLTLFEQCQVEFREDVLARRMHIAQNGYFNLFIVVVIFVNTILIGCEVDNSRGDDLHNRMGFFAVEIFFTLVFFFEMLCRLNQLSWEYFVDPWNVFDYALVVISVADFVISATKSRSGGMRLISSLRIFRLLRVVRSIKGLKIVAGLWLIIQGILDSIRTVFWVTLAAIILIYCFAVALTTLAGHEQSVKDQWHLADIYVGSVGKSMMTIMQVITLDSWTEDIARPLLDIAPITLVVIMMAIVCLTFGTLNILVAVMVERIASISQDSKVTSQKVLEKTENTLLRSIASEFETFDKDGNGQLDFFEFRKMIRTKSLGHKLGLLGVQVDEAEGLFDLMDVDKSGTVTPGEFISGLQKLKGFAKGQDVVQLICFAQKQVLRATRFVERLEDLNYSADKIQERLNIVGRGLSSEMAERRDAAVRVDNTWQNAAERQLVIRQIDIDRQHRYPLIEAEEEEDES
eukprot:TRINITY_DN38226_c0_g1_i1.p1 TRINITY_DN38226_c0_g1~~TRINITY_DN38226_c0_g1_i1.p1  ORF type:complete len:477 (-),score=93.35 TRINITY_DN38226_c0_g1_i1:13-1443(-)